VTRYLLDTHIVYYWMRADRRIGQRARGILARADCSVSVASIWEMLLKNVKGKLPLPEGPIGEHMEAQGFRLLPITTAHVEATRRFERSLPDPFDRLIVAIAAAEGMQLLTQDAAILRLAGEIPLPVVEAV